MTSKLQVSGHEAIGWALALAALIGFLLSRRRRPVGKKLPMPPGRLPIIGHRRALGPERPWLKMKEWADTYGNEDMSLLFKQEQKLMMNTGPIYRIQVGRQEVVVISDARTANALLDKRSSIYSSRPHSVVGVEYVGRGLRLLFMP